MVTALLREAKERRKAVKPVKAVAEAVRATTAGVASPVRRW